MTNREILLNESIKWLGKDASPFNKAPNEFGCVESLCSMIRHSIAKDFPLLLATWLLLKELRADKRFKTTLDLKAGNIILSPTGFGNNTIRGHTGIISKTGIISADSTDGIWKENYTIKSWVDRFRNKGQMPIYVFEPVGEYETTFSDDVLKEKLLAEKMSLMKKIKDILEKIKDILVGNLLT